MSRAGIAQCPEDISQLESVPLTKKGRAGWATGYLSLFGQVISVPSRHPTQTRKAETPRDDQGRRRKAGAATSSHATGSSDLLYRQTQQIARLKKPTARTAWAEPCRFPRDFTPQVFMVTDASHLGPSPLPSTSSPPEPGNHTAGRHRIPLKGTYPGEDRTDTGEHTRDQGPRSCLGDQTRPCLWSLACTTVFTRN